MKVRSSTTAWNTPASYAPSATPPWNIIALCTLLTITFASWVIFLSLLSFLSLKVNLKCRTVFTSSLSLRYGALDENILSFSWWRFSTGIPLVFSHERKVKESVLLISFFAYEITHIKNKYYPSETTYLTVGFFAYAFLSPCEISSLSFTAMFFSFH